MAALVQACKEKNAEANQAEEGINRYRRDWDAGAMAGSPDTAADTLNSAASTRPIARAQEEEANWIFCAASLTVTITT
jgi:hypothetical protein